ncbi:hypothetical protein HPP92_023396 [Vanilla planifolia]|uniref:Fructokinase n=1 Tax=Vanilla planifolia TaxID=51239 RepID=A0A835UGB6_VANPL|nr:hypothetical protein HPP92_023714 [Vanilla planifolia]KAG0460268.1 hypothetical protein HPP92_023396 [Vanilla planifolia]
MTAATGTGGGRTDGLVVCFGEMLIDFVPTVAGVSLADAPAFVKAPGGARLTSPSLFRILRSLPPSLENWAMTNSAECWSES